MARRRKSARGYTGSTLWGGAARQTPSDVMTRFSGSFGFDRVLLPYDVAVNRAWAEELRRVGVLTEAERRRISTGLDRVLREGADAGKSRRANFEDVHSFVEIRLFEWVGDSAKKLHTGKSRNDQVATDVRLYVMDRLKFVRAGLAGVIDALVDRAEKNIDVVFPSYTHLRQAQPVLFAHVLLAYADMFLRDLREVQSCLSAADEMPLGCGAVAGTAYPIDRMRLARTVGFSRCSLNSVDAVGDRDFIVRFLSWAVQFMVHASRMAEDWIVWSSEEFGLLRLPEAFGTGSSLMPQKLNPDALELIRGRAGRTIGNLVRMLVVLKGTPTSYVRDLQEDKEALFDSAATVGSCLELLPGLIGGMRVDAKRARAVMAGGTLLATDVADRLVDRGVPFREAHEAAGRLVRWCLDRKVGLDEAPDHVLRSCSKKLDRTLMRKVSIDSSIARRDSLGGTSRRQVLARIRAIRNEGIKHHRDSRRS